MPLLLGQCLLLCLPQAFNSTLRFWSPSSLALAAQACWSMSEALPPFHCVPMCLFTSELPKILSYPLYPLLISPVFIKVDNESIFLFFHINTTATMIIQTHIIISLFLFTYLVKIHLFPSFLKSKSYRVFMLPSFLLKSIDFFI